MNHRTARYWFLLAVAVHVWLGIENAVSNPVLVDEYGHLPAGVSYWDTGRFTLYRENPPLISGLAGLPVWLSGARMDYRRADGVRSEWRVGLDFLDANSADVPRFLTQGRMVVLALSVLTGALIFLWASKHAGAAAAIVCSWLWLMDPNVLAFSTIVTADVGAACFGLLATFWFWKFLRSEDWQLVVLSGAGLGLALASKFTLLALYPAWFAIAIAFLKAEGPFRPSSLRRLVGRLILVGIIALVVLNSIYLFDGSFAPVGSYRFKSRLLSGEATEDIDAAPSANRFEGTFLARLPLPLPKDFVLGLDSQRWEEEIGLKHMSGGRLVQGGRWDGPLRAIALKLPPGTLLILAASLVFLVVVGTSFFGADGLIVVPGLAFVGVLCTQTGLNWPIRYVLPALPFLVLGAARPIEVAWGHRFGRAVIVAALAWNAVDVARVRPSYLGHANPIVGGPADAQRLFVGSNYDWGQDLTRLRAWADRNATGPVALTYYGAAQSERLGVPTRGLPVEFFKTDQPIDPSSGAGPKDDFYWAISSNILNGLSTRITLESGARFFGTVKSPHLKPGNAVARIGNSIHVFRVSRSPATVSKTPSLRFEDLKHCLVQYERRPLEIDAAP